MGGTSSVPSGLLQTVVQIVHCTILGHLHAIYSLGIACSHHAMFLHDNAAKQSF